MQAVQILIYKDENQEIVLADFKTSTSPYSLKFPKATAGLEDKVKKALISGVFKAKKTMLQMAAYSLAAENCLGIHVDKTRIIVSTPLPEYSVQVFSFSRKELEKHMELWLQVLGNFTKQLE
jgi:hypothetical protein